MNKESVAVLITDMEGSTAFTASRGDEAAMEVLRVHESIVRRVLSLHGGREIKSMGDGFMLAFPSGEEGVACALDIQDALREHNIADPARPINVRMGLNVGPVIEEGGDIYGTTVNAAARIAAKARSGQLLTSQAAAEVVATQHDCAFVDRGLFWLKGLRERWRLFEAVRGAVVPSRAAIGDDRTPFVDRDHERAVLRRAVDAARDGHGGLVLLSGESGCGKTRLAEEVGREASERGMETVAGRCYEVSREHPFAPLVDVLETLERRLDPSAFRVALGESAGEVARLLPHLRQRFPDIPMAAELPPEQERRYLFASVVDVLGSIARGRPLYLLWDDLHWADEGTLRFLEHIANELASLPVLIVCTHTTGGPADNRLDEALERLYRRRFCERLEIGVLRRVDIYELLRILGKGEPPDVLVDALYRQTEGNAFFFEELVRHLMESGELLDEEGWRGGIEQIDVEIPESLRLTIQRRLGGVSEATRNLLTRAALIGRGFGFDLLEDVSEVEEDDLLDALDEAERVSLITSTTDRGLVRFSFSHELIRRTLIENVSLARRQRLHLRIADAMERIYATSLPEHAADILSHLELSGLRDADRGVGFLTMAGERAIETSAYPEAHRHLTRALELVPDDDPARRAYILERLGLAARSLARPDEAIVTWGQALDAYAAAGDRSNEARLCLDAALQVAFWLRGGRAHDLVARGLRVLADDDVPVRAGLLGLAGALATQTEDYARGAELFDEALPIARKHGDPRILGMVLYARMTHHFTFNEYVDAIRYGDEAITHLRRAGDLWNLANALGYAGAACMWLGRFQEGNVYGREGEELARRLGNWSALIFSQRARIYPWFGESPDIDWYASDGRIAYELGEGQGFRWLSALGQTRMGLAAFWRGRWDDALGHFEEASRLEPPGAAGGHIGGLILTHAYVGNHDDARRLLEHAMPVGVEGSLLSMRAEAIALIGIEALAIMGSDDEAAALRPIVQSRIENGIVGRGWDYRLIWTLAGIAATCAGDLQDAEAQFEIAIERAEHLPMRLEMGDALRFYGWMLLRRNVTGDRERARDLLQEAIANYERIGMPSHAGLARQMLATA
jgi:class 3 adenylate cyclase/tetratricopeptide (TPR) repeat protein